jgi:DNA-binding protein HU-beta
MNKAELIDAVAAAADLPKGEASRAVEAVTQAIADELSKGGQVAIVGFGTFQVKHRAARTGRNPKTGEALQIPASNVPSFKAGKALKDAVN